MKNKFRNYVVLVSIISLFFSCSKNEDEISLFQLVYEDNNSTGGIGPIDNKNYEEGQSVTIETSGSMVKVGHSFSSWNTEVEGNGALYMPGDALIFPSNNVMFYAQWEYDPMNPFVTCAQKPEIKNSINTYACNLGNGYTLAAGNSYWIRSSIGFKGEDGETRANEALTRYSAVVMLNNDTLPMDKSPLVEYNSIAGFWEVNSYHCTGILAIGQYNLKGTTSLNGSVYDEVECKLKVK